MPNTALIDADHNVVNVIVLDDGAEWSAPEGLSAVSDPSGLVSIGWTYDGANFVAPPVPEPTAAEQILTGYSALTTAGLSITSTGSPSISATYAVDEKSQANLSGIAATIGFLGEFPGGGSSFVYPDISSNPIVFSSVADFRKFYSAYVSFVLQISQALAIKQAGGEIDWPSGSVAIS